MPCANSPPDSERYRSRQPPMTSKVSRAKPAGSILAWHALHVSSERCLSSCWRIVTAPRISGSMAGTLGGGGGGHRDRKSTRLNSSHVEISYAVCCLKKKKKEST